MFVLLCFDSDLLIGKVKGIMYPVVGRMHY